MGKLNAGDLRERVVLLSDAPPLSDGRGGQAPGVTIERPVWARVRVLTPGQALAVGQLTTTTTLAVTVRRLAAGATPQRLRWQGTAYHVLGSVPDETREFHVLTCVTSGQ